jgi:RNA polymerase sigma-70 factor (ECF subfamily)
VNRPDERLLVEAAQRDPARFADLYELHFERVYAFVARRVRGRAEAEDVTSEVFHRALHNIRKFQWRGTPFVAWLYRIAANEIIDRARRAAREIEMTEEPAVEEIEDAERRAMLFRLVEQLPDAQRHVIVKRFAEEQSIAEVAHEMGRTEGAIKQLQFRALETLRRHYA